MLLLDQIEAGTQDILGLKKEELYKRFKDSFYRNLTVEEARELREISQEYPYFSLPRVLQSKSAWAEGRLMAGAYVSNRRLLRDFLDGKLYFAEIETAPSMEDLSGRRAYRILFPPHPFDHFSILEGMGRPFPEVEEGKLFSIPFSNAHKISGPAFLQHVIDEKIEKYIAEVGRIRTQLRHRHAEEARKFKKTIMADGLVDQFLEQLPQIAPHVDPFDPKEQEEHKAAAESIRLKEEEFVSETLAKLHLKQNNKAEARRIYRILCLRFPEKSAYFEAQLKKLEG